MNGKHRAIVVSDDLLLVYLSEKLKSMKPLSVVEESILYVIA